MGNRYGKLSGGLDPQFPEPSTLTATERTILENSGAWGPSGIARPYATDTLNDGMTTLFDGAAVQCPKGAYGTVYGPRVSEAAMADLKQRADWDAGSNRLQLNSDTAANDGEGNYLIEGKLDGGRVNIPSPPFASPVPVKVRDFAIVSPAGAPDCFTVNIDDTDTTEPPRVDMEYGRCEGALNGASLRTGTIKGVLLDKLGADGLELGISKGLFVEQCMVRRPAFEGYAAPDIHEDAAQGEQAKNLSIVASTLYNPSQSGNYGESDFSKNGGVFIAATNLNTPTWAEDRITDGVLILGNIIAGGGSSVFLKPRPAGSEMRNVLLAYNRYAKVDPGDGSTDWWTAFNHLRLEETDETGTWANLAVFDELTTDGGAVKVSSLAFGGDLTEARMGVYNWDKAIMLSSDGGLRWREALWRLGYATGRTILDWNGDLQSAWNRGAID